MNLISYLKGFLALFIARFADNSVESAVAGFSKIAAKLEAIADHHAAEIDKVEAVLAAAAAKKIASQAEIEAAQKVSDNIRKLLSR